jgi:hypothetical protein
MQSSILIIALVIGVACFLRLAARRARPVESIMEAIGLPIWRVPVKRGYVLADVTREIRDRVARNSVPLHTLETSSRPVQAR